jgi:hypothetical protein
MQSNNFLLLKSRWPQLYQHANFSEAYVYLDPPTATIKLRCFAEALVGILYQELNLPSGLNDGFFEKLQAPYFEKIVESPIRQKLHAIRSLGNKAAHGGDISTENALRLLKEAYLLGQWLYKIYSGEIYDEYPAFSLPMPQNVLTEDITSANELLARQLEQAKQELEDVQAAERAANRTISELNATLDQVQLDYFRNSAARASSTINLEEESTLRLLSIEDAFSEYTLNDGQKELVKRLGVFLSGNTESAFLLKGYAGTGKTFITKGLTEYFRSIGRNYVLAAPTGKASKVIAEKTKSPAFTIHKTIYSFKDFVEFRDDDLDGTETYKFYAELAVNEMSVDTVFIIDEASMVADIYNEAEFFRFGSGYLLKDFFKFVNLDHNDHRKKVIFIGDDAQLPPVGMSSSPALDAEYLYRKYSVRSASYELTEVVRQKDGSGVLRNSIKLRKAIQEKVFNHLTVDLYPDVVKIEHWDLMSHYLESCGGRINGEAIVIAHSNADVAAYNKSIRDRFFPECLELADGDKVMAVSNSNTNGFFISNGDFGLIKKVLNRGERRSVKLKRKNKDSGKVEEIIISLAFRDVIIGFKDHEGNARFFQAKIMEDLLYSDHATLTSDENKALYLDFCIRNNHLKRKSQEFKNTLMSDPYFNALRLKFGYAITCHKAQGSEWNHVFVKCETNQSQLSSGYFRWFYTAITRSAKKLYLLDPPNIKLGSDIKMVMNPGNVFPLEAAKDKLTVILPSIKQHEIKVPIHENMGESEQSDIKVVELHDDESNTFGIPTSVPFLLALLGRVRELIKDTDIRIDNIEHKQYLEVYFFRRGNDYARIDLGYNGKEKITRLTAPHSTVMADDIISLLASLKGEIVTSSAAVPAIHFCFEENFLNELHQRLILLTEERGMAIKNAVKHQWNLRYTFAREREVAVYDIFFDGKHNFTKSQVVITACSPGSLVRDVQVMLTEGLRA